MAEEENLTHTKWECKYRILHCNGWCLKFSGQVLSARGNYIKTVVVRDEKVICEYIRNQEE